MKTKGLITKAVARATGIASRESIEPTLRFEYDKLIKMNLEWLVSYILKEQKEHFWVSGYIAIRGEVDCLSILEQVIQPYPNLGICLPRILSPKNKTMEFREYTGFNSLKVIIRIDNIGV